jgi:superfamily II DNA or RNA helicase
MGDVDNPFTKLKNSRYFRGSQREEVLFDFFEVELPEEDDDDTKPGLTSLYPEYGLFDYQRQVSNGVNNQLNSHDNRIFLHMHIGSGKTRITMSLICDIVKKSDEGLVFWRAEGQELLDQAAEEFENAWNHLGDREVEISRFYGSYEWNEIEEGFIVAGLQKLWNKEKTSPAFLANFAPTVSLVVFDEAHRSVADTYQKMLERIKHYNPDCGLLGLSATPGRTYADRRADKQLSEMYNQNKVSIDVPGYDDPFEYLTSEGYLSKPKFHNLEMSERILTDRLLEDLRDLNEGDEYPTRVLERLAEHDLRNIRIAKKILELIEEGHTRIILFATTVDHARIISAVLKAQDVESSVITSKTPDYIREREIRGYKKSKNTPRVLCNYNVLTTGLDDPQTSAAVIARPTTSLVLYSQMVGRAIRGPKVGGTEEAEIWTVIDTELPGFGDLAEAFWNWEDVW